MLVTPSELQATATARNTTKKGQIAQDLIMDSPRICSGWSDRFNDSDASVDYNRRTVTHDEYKSGIAAAESNSSDGGISPGEQTRSRFVEGLNRGV